MTRLRGWCHCGGPLLGAEGCRVCSLVRMTSQHVRWHDDEARGYDAEGQSINELEHQLALEHFAANRADANSTANTAARSRWLPPGANDPTVRRVSTYAVGAAFGGKAWRERRDQTPKGATDERP